VVCCSFEGWPDKYNQWINEKDIRAKDPQPVKMSVYITMSSDSINLFSPE